MILIVEGIDDVSSLAEALRGWCVHTSPDPIFGGSLAVSSPSLSASPSALLELLDRDFFFFFFRGDDDEKLGGGLCRMNRVRSSPGRTARGGGSKAATATASGGGGRPAGAGGRAAAVDMMVTASVCG